MKQVRMTAEGKFLVFSTRESHTGPKHYFYETADINSASLFSDVAERTPFIRNLDEIERTKFRQAIPVNAREERKVILVHPDEAESEE